MKNGATMIVLIGWVWLVSCIWPPLVAVAQENLVSVHQDFSKDPGWEFRNNRIEAHDPPIIKQDFGWSSTNHSGGGTNGVDPSGEIGGMIWLSRTPAYYALALGRPLSFNDKFSFACRIAFVPRSGASPKDVIGGTGAAYLGFFNHELQGWRPWNSMAVRLTGGKVAGKAVIGADAMTALWHACGGSEGFIDVPADGKPHTLRFTYDPQAVPGTLPDPKLKNYFTSKRQTVDDMLPRARQDEPEITRQQLYDRLVAAHSAGLIGYLDRRGGTTSGQRGELWSYREAKDRQGVMILEIDNHLPYKMYISKRSHNEPVYMDRFGIFNFQMYHGSITFFLSDLSVNGHKVDLSKDPGWEGRGNRVEFAERDFHRQDYGYSETNWAGDQIGEIGGQFTNVEPVDPLTGYYADDIGVLTLADPISFSGNVCFVADSTDAGMQIGYFSVADAMGPCDPHNPFRTIPNSIGVQIEGSADSGKRFMPQINTGTNRSKTNQDIPFNPTKQRHKFKFQYDPTANRAGRITLTLDDKTSTLDLTPEQRQDGAHFDHFGVANLRAGGKFVEFYFDDLTYTARRPKDYRPLFHKQQVIKVPYPPGGRKY
jgi:hypothetical protein